MYRADLSWLVGVLAHWTTRDYIRAEYRAEKQRGGQAGSIHTITFINSNIPTT